MTGDTIKNKYESSRLHLGILIIAILIAYIKVFHAGFMTWDDGEYVLHNNDIRSFDPVNVRAWFSSYYIGNYHPLTMVSYAIDFMIGKQNALIYHVTGILLHICNTCLLYLFIKRIQPQPLIALFVALVFAVHPSQTESVSWIGERKTILFAFFYLLALVQYTKYVVTPSASGMALVFIWGAAAMLSKGMAVPLPLSLLAVDIWMGRNLKVSRPWVEKLPLIILSVIMGMVAIKAQESGKFLDWHPQYGGGETILYAGYAYVQYIIHFLVPAQLSVIYPYPEGGAGVMQYLFSVLALFILCMGVWSYRRQWYVLCGGIAFYTVNIVLLLQFIQFGDSLMADRYLYVAGIGILYPAVYYAYTWLGKRSRQAVPPAIMGIVAGVFLVMTFFRNDIWLSDFNFFNAMLDTFPNSAVAQYSVGAQLMKMGEYDKAELHMDKAVRIDPNNYKAWHNKGSLHLRQGRPMEALEALDKSIAINDYYKAHFTRAMLHEGTGKPDLALADIDKVLVVQPQNARAWYIKADCQEQMGKMDAALDNYNKAIEYESAEPLFFIRRGLLYGKMRKNTPAINDLNTAVALNPANGEALYYRGIIKYQNGISPCADLQGALQHGYRQAQPAIDKMCKK